MTRSYTYSGQSIDYQIIYKKRKSLGIYIDVYGNIELRVPREATEQQVQDLIETKWLWIIEKQSEMKEKTKGFKVKEYEDGETFLLLGVNYPIQIIIDDNIGQNFINIQDKVLIIKVKEADDEVIKKLLIRFYKQQCKKLVEERIRYYQPNFKVKPRGIKISGNKKSWGTCNSYRELTFNWKLAMAPLEIIDYVVVHEMCHMVHMNHDRSFWRLVGKYIPNYESCQTWLRNSYWKMVV